LAGVETFYNIVRAAVNIHLAYHYCFIGSEFLGGLAPRIPRTSIGESGSRDAA
jgi:hypothetical protein